MLVTDEMVATALSVAARHKIQGADGTSIREMLQAAFRVGLSAKDRIKVRIRASGAPYDNKVGVLVGTDGKSGQFRVELKDGKQLMVHGNEILGEF